jgi:hypothetical protein
MAADTLEDRLNAIFANVNNWLKFAEAKNGVLLSLNGGAIIGVLAYVKEAPEPNSCSLTWTLIPAFILATLFLLVSFLPLRDKIVSKERKSKGPEYAECNLLYFKHIRNFSPRVYLERLNNSMPDSSQETFTKLEEDIAQQIVTNAGIAYRKYWYFIIGFVLDMIGVVVALAFFIYMYVNNVSLPFCEW